MEHDQPNRIRMFMSRGTKFQCLRVYRDDACQVCMHHILLYRTAWSDVLKRNTFWGGYVVWNVRKDDTATFLVTWAKNFLSDWPYQCWVKNRRFGDLHLHRQVTMETQEISETMVLNPTLTWLIAQEDFTSCIRRESFKCYVSLLVYFLNWFR
jgi:hypothetical protein